MMFRELLGPEAILPEQARKDLPAGVATGLAWTETGGDVLYIEATLLPSGKELTITGQLGEVMQESAKTARSYLWSHAEEFGIDAGPVPESGLAYSRAGRCDSERWAVGRCHDDYGVGLALLG